jgi:uncharacterized protein (DUF58 family)
VCGVLRGYPPWLLFLVACEVALAVAGIILGNWWLVVAMGISATTAMLAQRDKRKRGRRDLQ